MPEYIAPLRITKPAAWSRESLKARWHQLRELMELHNYQRQNDVAEFERIGAYLHAV